MLLKKILEKRGFVPVQFQDQNNTAAPASAPVAAKETDVSTVKVLQPSERPPEKKMEEGVIPD